MKRFLLFKVALLGLLFQASSSGDALAQIPERKIIVQDNRYFFTTVADEFQLATLHTAALALPPAAATQLALPAGRNYDEPVNLFSWDVRGSWLFAINFLNHPMNDRYEALKRLPLQELKSTDSAGRVQGLLLQSTEQYTYTDLAPYRFLKQQTHMLDHFFYDMVATDTNSLYVVLNNAGNWWLWHFNGTAWWQKPGTGISLNEPFSIFYLKNELYLFTENGRLYRIDTGTGTAVPKVIPKKTVLRRGGILLEDRDAQQLYWLAAEDFNPQQTISILKQKGVRLL